LCPKGPIKKNPLTTILRPYLKNLKAMHLNRNRNRILLGAPAVHSPIFWWGAVCLIILSFAFLAFGIPGKEDPELRQALNKMDEVAENFYGFEAAFSQTSYTAVIDEFSIPEAGRFYYSPAKDGSVRMRHEITHPGKRVLTITNGIATLYEAGISQATIYTLGKRQELVEYLALGIGQTSEQLKKKFDVSYEGSGEIGAEPCWILLLKPKDSKVTSHLTAIKIWLKKSSGTPAQYEFHQPSEDYLRETFSDEKLMNKRMDDSLFKQNLPKGVEIRRIQ
jgi:outer membrane lipoprotein-sorting protein